MSSRWGGWALGRALLRLSVGLVVLAAVLLLAAWLALHWLILPRLDDWRPRIERQASQALGHPVQIGHIAVHSAGWVPAFVLQDVVLRDVRGREALRLPQVSAALAVPQLLAGRLRFAQLLIEDARLEVRRDAQGRLHVAGLDIAGLATEPSDAGVDGSAAADWLFEQHEIVIRGGLLRWVDEQRTAPALQLADVLLVLRNSGRHHDLRLDATPPADWGQRFSLRAQAKGPLLARAGDWQRWQGTLYADLPQADVRQLRRHVDLPVDLQQGQASLRAWVDWDQGLPLALTLDAALQGVSVRLAPDLEPLAFNTLSGRFVASRSASGVKLAVQSLAFTRADGPAWAPSQLGLQWRQTQPMAVAQAGVSHPVTGGEINADRLDLEALAALAERLPIGAGLRSLLQQLDPVGTVKPLQARWDGPLDAPSAFSAQAKVQGLAIRAAPSPEPGGIGRPGWRGADLDIQVSETGGQAQLTLLNGVIDLPGVFEQSSVPLAHFSSDLRWRVIPATPVLAAAAGAASTPATPAPRIELALHNTRFDNADTTGTLAATWHSGAGSGFGKGGRLPGLLELSGSLTEARATQVARYLPLGIGQHTRAWVQRAVQAGVLRDVNFRVKGDLWDFPYVNKRDGEFRIATRVQDATLAPVPSVLPGGAEPAWDSPWPAIGNVSGELVFERNAMEFRQASGRLWGLVLSDVQGRIRELSDKALLEVDGQVHGPAADLLRYLNTTPLGAWTGDALAQATASGAADLKLQLNIPLGSTSRIGEAQVKASVQLAGNDLRLAPDGLLLPNARGRIEATHKGVQVSALRSQLAGGDALIEGGTQPDGGLRFNVAGSATADGLRRWADAGALARLAAHLQGQANYKAQVDVRPGQLDWQLSSGLTGMAINLPAPLRKLADTSLPLHLSVSGQPEWLRLELGLLQAQLQLDRSPGGLRVPRMAAAYNSALPEPVPGGRVVLAVPQLDADAWQALDLAAAPLVAPPAGAAAPAAAPVATAATAQDTGWLPQSVQLKTPDLLVGGRRLTGVNLALQRLITPGDEGWRVQGSADQAAGTLDYREPRAVGSPGGGPGGAGAGRIRARLSRLSLPQAGADVVTESVAGLLERSRASSVPALDIEVQDFELRGHKLGQLTVQAVNRAGSVANAGPGLGQTADLRSAWLLQRLDLKNDDADLSATGQWQALAGQAQRRMGLDFTLNVKKGGALLQRLGLGAGLKGADGTVTGKLAWLGSPLAFDLPTLGGTLGLNLVRGQFLELDPGAARLLGVLSLQALPRRLMLDFSDVLQAGFAFDSLTGEVQIERGVARTDTLRIRGPQATLLMAGQADIARETQDLHVVAVPELNTASASLAYAAINPAIGLGAFVGQWLLREPLRQVSAREFRITGSWDDPKMERVARGLLVPLPAAAVAGVDATPARAAANAAATAAANAATAPKPAASGP